jgi:hypothetical protein
MAKEKRGMEAVLAKTSKVGRPRKPVMQRKGKGPGVAIMIAVGKPKGEAEEMPKMGKGPSMREELDASKGEGLTKSQKISALQEKIAYLKAELALLEGEDDSEEEMDDEMGDESDDED